jgi:acyl phosphate:glycerol-3-phosphate acyltransferase
MSIELILLFFAAVTAYFIGGIPTGKIIVWQLKKVDIQKIGSKNIGTTNVYRALGFWWSILVFFLDFLKGLFPVAVAWYIFKTPISTLVVGYSLVLGNIFSPYLKFKGGKAVAVSAGICFFLFNIFVLISLLFGLAILKLVKKMSIATFSGLAMCTYLVIATRSLNYQIFMVLLAATILFTHRENIKRLLSGNEPKLIKF